MRGSAKTVFLAWTALLASFAGAGAQTAGEPPPPPSATEEERRSIFTIQVENDFFNLYGRSDRDYTNGARLGWLSPALTSLPPSWVSATTIPTFFGEAPADSVVRRFGVSIGQNIYTPA